MYPLERMPGEATPTTRSPARTPAGSRPSASTTPTAKPTRSNWPGSMTPACSEISPPTRAQPACAQPSATPATSASTMAGYDFQLAHYWTDVFATQSSPIVS